jgi:ribosomal protein S18 acetylase RimI-like enzyme
MSQVQIRSLGINDYDRIMDLWRRSGLTSLRPLGRDSRDAFAHQLGAGRGLQTVLGLEKKGELIGVVVATHDGRKGWINRLTVDPDHRRRGHAKQLIVAAEQAIRSQGIHVIAALIERDNEASLELFQRAGYHLNDQICYLSKRDSDEV